jgi:hypothetical protein
MKQSGIERKAGIEGVLEYLQMQTITTYGRWLTITGPPEAVVGRLVGKSLQIC